MKIQFDARLVDFDPKKTMDRFNPRFNAAQKWLDNEVLKDCSPFTPFKTGMLDRSGPAGTTLGEGEVVYNTPYARRLYYGTHFNFNRTHHPQAGAQWFEKAKAIKKKAWLDGADKILKG